MYMKLFWQGWDAAIDGCLQLSACLQMMLLKKILVSALVLVSNKLCVLKLK